MGKQVMGFCLKCKTYCDIANARQIVMSNGRTRMAGNCSNRGCDGKISKIVGWLFQRILHLWPPSGRITL